MSTSARGNGAAPHGRVLVVDDDPMVAEVLGRYLERDGFSVDVAADGGQALAVFHAHPPQLVILDLMLPVVSGLDVLRQMRAHGDVPVILLSARGDEADRVTGLEVGADDYVVKPFSPREVVARVRSILRRLDRGDSAHTQVRLPGLIVDTATREVLVDGELVELTRKQFDLLAHLASHPRRVWTRAQLLEQVWDSSPEWQDPATVTVHIRQLRQKVEPNPRQPTRITTVRGVGYRFEP